MTRSRPWSMRTAVAVALLTALTQVGCVGLASGGSVVSLDDGDATVCAPADAEGRAVFGVSTIRNVSGMAVEIVGAQLVNAHGMELLGIELRAADDPDANVVGLDYSRYGPHSIALPHEMAAEQTSVTLVGVRVAPGERGTSDALRLSFTGSGSDGVVETNIAMHVVPAGDVCRMTG